MCWVIRKDMFMAGLRRGLRTASQLRQAAHDEPMLHKQADWGQCFCGGVHRIVEPEHSATRQRIGDALAEERRLQRELTDCKRQCSRLRREMQASSSHYRADLRIEIHRIESVIENTINPGLEAVALSLRDLTKAKLDAEVTVECLTWDDVRFVLESKSNFVVEDPDDIEAIRSRKLGKKHRERIGGQSVIVGMRGVDASLPENHAHVLSGTVLLRDLAVLDPETVIVWQRVPADDNKHNTHIPPRFQTIRTLMMYRQRWRPELERAQYAGVLGAINIPGSAEKLFRVDAHPSLEYSRKHFKGFLDESCNECEWGAEYIRPPPCDYVCGRCCNYFADPPHRTEQCPTIGRDDWVAMCDRPQPSSIPISQMREVRWDGPEAEVAAAVYVKLDSEGGIRLFNPR